MNAIDLKTLLQLVGKLADSDDPNSASTRFRAYVRENIQGASDLRAYVESALSTKGEQTNWALQDLINHAGHLLGFEVIPGRYRGAQGHIGFDGLWRSPTGRALVIETKTTDVYAVKTAPLLGYINDLVSEGQIGHPKDALGLYVYGRFDAEASQLENAIIVEGRQETLRVVSVDALLNLLELQQQYELDHQTVLQLLIPPPVRIDTLVDLLFDITSQERRQGAEEKPVIKQDTAPQPGDDVSYYVLPAADSEDGTPVLENLHHWLGKGMWGLGQRTAHRKAFRPGDHICFYAARIGIVVECLLTSSAFEMTKKQSPKPHLDIPYGMRLEKVRWFEDAPVPLTTEIRAELTAFEGRDLSKGWAWFIQSTSKVTQADFELLTGHRLPGQKTVPGSAE